MKANKTRAGIQALIIPLWILAEIVKLPGWITSKKPKR
jgi:hypothetical protein